MSSPSSPLQAPAEVPEVPTSENVVDRTTVPTLPAAHRRVFLKIQSHTCCVGVDMPGVGHTHAPDCPAMARRAKLPAALADFVSEPPCREFPSLVGKAAAELLAEINAGLSALNERRNQRERLFAQLLFAARDLAEVNLFSGHLARTCTECGKLEELGRMQHINTCKTGRVLGIVANLVSTLDFDPFKPTEKEEAPDGETSRAGDGIRPRGLTVRTCLRCGARGLQDRGYAWITHDPQNYVDLSLLGLNQCVLATPNGKQVLYTHCCPPDSVQSKGDKKVEPCDGSCDNDWCTATPALQGEEPRELKLFCLKCGVLGGALWESRWISETDFRTHVLAINECADALPIVSMSGMRVIYTHRCTPKGCTGPRQPSEGESQALAKIGARANELAREGGAQ